MPLWTILTKWPAPLGPQCSQPSSSGAGRPVRPPVRAAAATPGASDREHRREPSHRRVRPADHQAEAALPAEHAAAHADVHVVDALRAQLLGPPDVVAVERVAAVHDGVARGEPPRQVVHDGLRHAGRHHDPDGPRRGELLDELVHRARPGGALGLQARHGVGAVVVGDALVAGRHEPAHHVRAHPAQADHAELHSVALLSYPAASVLRSTSGSRSSAGSTGRRARTRPRARRTSRPRSRPATASTIPSFT